jgi:hypothetical protein
MLNLIKKIQELENKPSNNKLLKESFRIIYPYGTMPRKIDDLRKQTISHIEVLSSKNPPKHLLNKVKPFLTFIKEI